MSSSYQEAVNSLLALNRSAGDREMTLDNARLLEASFGHPSRSYPIIHVAGTNGKGSTVTKIAKALELSGYRVGMYTSPHLSCFRERICINGVMISEDQITKLIQEGFAHCSDSGLAPSFFEITTCAAFRHFANELVDVAVVEVGIGGRLDSTNIITPILSVITSIDLDHTQFLGSTRESIAREKAGIIKPHIPVVVGPCADMPEIQQVAEEKGSAYYCVEGTFANYDEENSAIAKQAIALTGFICSDAVVEAAMEARPPCRMQHFPIGKGVILDVAHNLNGVTRLLASMDHSYPNQPFHVVCGFSKDKEVAECLQMLTNKAEHVHLVSAKHDRAMPMEMLVKQSKSIEHSCHRSVAEGIQVALSSGQIVLICGTFFMMREARDALGIAQECDPFDLNEPAISLIKA
ncbi:MAG: folylpolyglutamate synthase/dihydrofolate synthase family protein [Chlamydiales bacterium]|nr:folylpolyglutamate synthase/dihydrofolate synthase family protein [Chlamydiales bacterium]